MEESSIIDFLKQEIVFFRELLSCFIAEEKAYKEADTTLLHSITLSQKELMGEIKNNHSKKITMINPLDEIEHSTLCFLKQQLESIIERVHFQKEKASFFKNCLPPEKIENLTMPKLQVETLEDEC